MTRLSFRDAPVGVVFFLLAALAIITTRFDGGLAFLWGANAFLITVLLQRRRCRWAGAVLWSAAGSMLATSLFGVGWEMAPFLAIANIAEAIVAAFLMRRSRTALMAIGSLRWNLHMIAAAGIAGPLAMAAVAALPLWLHSGAPLDSTVVRALAGHGLSNLTFIPILKLLAAGNRGALRRVSPTPFDHRFAALFAVMIAITALVFVQSALPLLFVPLLPLVAIVVRGDSRRTAFALLALAFIGSAATLSGVGPVQLIGADIGLRMQFLQFYLLATVVTIVPIAAQQSRSRNLLRRLRESETRYRMIADHSSDLITHTDLSGNVLFVSPSIERLGGYKARDVRGRNILDIIDPEHHAPVIEQCRAAVANPGCSPRFEYRARTRRGDWRWFESVCRGVVGSGNQVESLVSIVRDISERREREQALAAAASTDPLTHLPNRRAFKAAVEDLLRDGESGPHSIAVIDIDHFKQINDRFGHEVGDEVLTAFASAARRMLRTNDMLARIGGEEFAILLPDLEPMEAQLACDRLRAAISKTPFLTAKGCVGVTLSGGIVALTGEGLDEALRRADSALYAAKAAGRDQLQVAA